MSEAYDALFESVMDEDSDYGWDDDLAHVPPAPTPSTKTVDAVFKEHYAPVISGWLNTPSPGFSGYYYTTPPASYNIVATTATTGTYAGITRSTEPVWRSQSFYLGAPANSVHIDHIAEEENG